MDVGSLIFIYLVAAFGGATGGLFVSLCVFGLPKLRRKPQMPTWASHRDWREM